MNTAESALLLIGLLVFTLQGCCTIAVKNIGVETESIQRCEEVCVGTDGSIASLVSTRFHQEGPLGGYSYSNKIVVGSPDVVKKAVSANSARNKDTLLVNVDIVDRELDGWHILPYKIFKGEAYINSLPASEQHNFKTCTSCVFRYDMNGKKENLFLEHYSFYKNRVHSDSIQHTSFWHYPAQLLLIPSVVFDVVTSPIQLVIIGRMTKQ